MRAHEYQSSSWLLSAMPKLFYNKTSQADSAEKY